MSLVLQRVVKIKSNVSMHGEGQCTVLIFPYALHLSVCCFVQSEACHACCVLVHAPLDCVNSIDLESRQ